MPALLFEIHSQVESDQEFDSNVPVLLLDFHIARLNLNRNLRVTCLCYSFFWLILKHVESDENFDSNVPVLPIDFHRIKCSMIKDFCVVWNRRSLLLRFWLGLLIPFCICYHLFTIYILFILCLVGVFFFFNMSQCYNTYCMGSFVCFVANQFPFCARLWNFC